jgi:hypothetical protein
MTVLRTGVDNASAQRLAHGSLEIAASSTLRGERRWQAKEQSSNSDRHSAVRNAVF